MVFEKRKSSGFSLTTKAESKILEGIKITRFLKPVNTAATYPSLAVSVEIIFASVFTMLLPKWLHAYTAVIFNAP